MVTQCQKCKKFVHDIGRHERRNRCKAQHIPLWVKLVKKGKLKRKTP